MSERYVRGVEIAEQLAADKLEEFLTSRVAELAPDFARMVIEFSPVARLLLARQREPADAAPQRSGIRASRVICDTEAYLGQGRRHVRVRQPHLALI